MTIDLTAEREAATARREKSRIDTLGTRLIQVVGHLDTKKGLTRAAIDLWENRTDEEIGLVVASALEQQKGREKVTKRIKPVRKDHTKKRSERVRDLRAYVRQEFRSNPDVTLSELWPGAKKVHPGIGKKSFETSYYYPIKADVKRAADMNDDIYGADSFTSTPSPEPPEGGASFEMEAAPEDEVPTSEGILKTLSPIAFETPGEPEPDAVGPEPLVVIGHGLHLRATARDDGRMDVEIKGLSSDEWMRLVDRALRGDHAAVA